jgi:hypothetical protein
LDYFLVHRRIEENLFRACKAAVICGLGYMAVEWDPRLGEVYHVDRTVDPETGKVTEIPLYEGDLVVTNYLPWDVVVDLARRDADHPWMITRRLVSRWDLAARYPQYSDEILEATDESKGWLKGTRDAFSAEDEAPGGQSDLIPVWTLYHRKTDACPQGKWASFLNARTLLASGPLPYEQIPVLRITAGETLNTSYGDSPLHSCLSLQDMLNRLVSAVATNNIAFGTQLIVGPDDADFNRSELAEGMSYLAVKPGPDGRLPKPEAVQLTASSPETYKLIEMVKGAIETLSGVNSVVRGDPGAGIKSGSFAALIQSQALQFTSDLQAAYTRLIEGTGNLIVQHLKRFAKSKRLAIIAGKTKSWMQKQFNQEDLQDIDRVMVQSANPVTKSPAFKLQMADQLVQRNLLTSAEEYLAVVETGSLQPLTEAKQLALLNVRKENEMLGEGQRPQAVIVDDHKLHILEHTGVLANPEARVVPGVVQAVLGHIQEHVDLWKSAPPDLLLALGIPVLPDGNGAPPPPGGPPGQGGPPPPALPNGGTPPVPPEQDPTGNLPNQPQNPINPLTGRRWDPQSGGQ